MCEVRVEIYRVFPNDSDVGRTSGPPTFGTLTGADPGQFTLGRRILDRSSNGSGILSFPLLPFEARPSPPLNSVLNPAGLTHNRVKPLGVMDRLLVEEIHFNIDFTDPFLLPAWTLFFHSSSRTQRATDNFSGCPRRGRWSLPAPCLPRTCRLVDSGRESRSGLASHRSRHCRSLIRRQRPPSTGRSRLREWRRTPVQRFWLL